MNGLLLAAGLGTRFRPFTNIIPKPAIPLLNVPTCLYNLHLIQQLGIDKITVNTHHLPEKVRAVFRALEDRESLTRETLIRKSVSQQSAGGDNALFGAELHFSDEIGEILGTGGAIKKARPTLEGRGTFVVANADVVNGFGIRDALEAHHREQPMATLVVIEHPLAGTKYGALWANEKDEVVAIGRVKPDENCKPYHFVGIHLIEESVFKYIPDGPCDITTHVYLPAIANGERVMIHKKSGMWFDAGNLEDYLNATTELLEVLPRLQHEPFFLSLYRRFWPHFDRRPNLWEGENCEHLLSLGSESKILMGNHCRIDSTARISGFAVFGNDALIEGEVILENVVVGEGVHIRAGAVHKNTLLL